MPTKPIDRLMFIQGGLCFFCKQPLPKAEASIEHLLATTHGGNNSDDNCVVCCKSFNALLGSMPLKEKFRVVLNQQGQFKCPNGIGNATTKMVSEIKATPAEDGRFNQVVTNLKQRGNSRPRSLKTLINTISSLYPKGLPQNELDELLKMLQSTGRISLSGNTISYNL